MLDLLLREDPAVMHAERDEYTFCVEVALRRALWKRPDLAANDELERAVRHELERMRLATHESALAPTAP
jgi:hypothetical protein